MRRIDPRAPDDAATCVGFVEVRVCTARASAGGSPREREARNEHDGTDPLRLAFDRYYRRLVTQVTALCGNLTEAEDIVQESFAVAMTHLHDIEAVADQEAWLRGIASNRLRSRRRRARLAARLLPGVGDELSIDLGPSAPEDQLAMVYALSRLSLPVRLTVDLHHVAGLGIAQIALELGVPEGVVRARLAEAGVEIGNHLVDHEGAHDV